MTVPTEGISHFYQPGAAMAAEAIPFAFLDAADVAVTHIADATGVRTLLVPGDDYVIAGDGSTAAATITAQAAWPADDVFELERITPPTQQLDIVAFEPLPANAIESQLDRLTMNAQEAEAGLGRSVQLPLGEPGVLLPPGSGPTLLLSVSTLAGIAGDITIAAERAEDIEAVAGIVSDVTTVADGIAAVGALAPISAEIATVAGISGNVTTVAGVSANVTTVAGIAASVSTLAGISGNVTTVAGISANVTIVAGAAAAVTTVATDIASVNSAAMNMAAIIAAPAQATAAAASAVLAASYASATIITTISEASNTRFSWMWQDQFLNIPGGIEQDGTLYVNTSRVGAGSAEVSFDSPLYTGTGFALSGYVSGAITHGASDSTGNLGWAVNRDGSISVAELRGATIGGDLADFAYIGATIAQLAFGIPGEATRIRPDLAGMTLFGQSNSVRGTAVNVQPYNTLTFAGGARWGQDGVNTVTAHASTVALSNSNATSGVEGWTGAFNEFLGSENGLTNGTDIQYQLLATCDGQSGMTAAQLSKGGAYYQRIMEDATAGMALVAAGSTYAFDAWGWWQGENDAILINSQKYSYLSTYRQIVNDISTDVRAITGQTYDPICLTWSVLEDWRIAQAQQRLAEAMPNVFMVAPKYFIPSTDPVHGTDAGLKWLAAYFGLAHKRIIIDGKGWEPLKPVSWVRKGKTVYIRYNMPMGTKLVLDTTLVPQAGPDATTAAPTFGFRVYAADQTTANPITSVSLSAPDTVKIVCQNNIAAGGYWGYVVEDGAASAGFFLRRGNLRDNAGATLTYNGGGLNKPLHNWAIISMERIS